MLRCGGLGLCLLSLAAGACRRNEAHQRAAGDDGRPPTVVQTIAVQPVQIPRTLSAVGTLESPQDTQIAGEIGGTVVFLDVPEGREVAAGHVLARLDPDQATAAVRVAEARYENAKDRFERSEALRLSTVISAQELDDAKAEMRAADGQLADARAVLRKTVIRAPFSGVLGLRRASLGAVLEPGAAVVRLTQIKPLHLVFGLPQRQAGEVAVGQPVRGMAGSCERRFAAIVSAIEPAVDAATRMIRVQAVVPNEDGGLRPGMSADVRLQVDSVPDALMVPQEAVVRRGTKRLVYTVEDDDQVQAREVTLGEFSAQQVQVVRGLDPGNVVVVRGHQKLEPHARVTAEPYDPIENPNLALGSNGTLAECDF